MAKKTPKPETQTEAPQEPSQEAQVQESPAPVEQASPEPAADLDAAVLSALAPEPEPAPVVNDAPISFEEPISEADLKAGVNEDPNKAIPPALEISAAELRALQNEAEQEDLKRDFTRKLMALREPPQAQEVKPPPVPDRIREQTRLEMEAGRKMNEHYEALHARHGRPRPEPETGTVSVFRPADYVPDPKKGQGNVATRNL